MIEVTGQINAVRRRVGERVLEAGTARTLTVSQTYDTDVEDLWDAVTNADRIARWFLPVSGELRLGGRYELEGNASGTIEHCDPPKGFSATWEYGGQTSWIEVRLTPEDGGRARFELEHIAHVDDHWEQFGPGAVGIGWDMGLLGLALHVSSGMDAPADLGKEWSATEEAKEFMRQSGEGWFRAHVATGDDEAMCRAAADRTIAAYTGDTPSQDGGH
ncbi:activator of Hsp90 ATPase-like protein [Actinomadura pelletieri DSM 43383]|uniref:Activator of Hsp90 ATPase-like protein n=1 Tax=Actinomadura pelletieri DSM 43383 TaxID=1120940 RepID=A0A495QKJ0_9ACTN|nr:SRPBCC family protein [Actinomadura pelletieri]RKS73028.1 activator of Hsp90 ATPase-like protein [Actinomadura pelletieri DSM 43383]